MRILGTLIFIGGVIYLCYHDFHLGIGIWMTIFGCNLIISTNIEEFRKNIVKEIKNIKDWYKK